MGKADFIVVGNFRILLFGNPHGCFRNVENLQALVFQATRLDGSYPVNLSEVEKPLSGFIEGGCFDLTAHVNEVDAE